jgi:hypothetical protein
VPEAAELVAAVPGDDPVTRLQRVDAALDAMICANEAALRLMLIHARALVTGTDSMVVFKA